jgi:lipopolysaccharide/colanic/teichoic acid biosynthesis glycosyltransferase
MMYRHFFKPVLDIFVSFIVFTALLPVFLLLIVFLAIANNGKAFFIQKRPGKNGIIFSLLKFKTMNDKTDEKGILLPDDKRLTGVGKFIRKTSLDELPQLINVIKGDISIIGPRPLLVDYLDLYTNEQNRRHEIKPGITGWAQINGRTAISWEKKFELDVWYIDHLSFMLDMKIVYLTLIKVFKSEGISSSTSLTMEKFTGTK